MDLTDMIYDLTTNFPSTEKFGLATQMRRAAVSVPSNIAEGQARHSTKEFLQFLSHASGSLAELDTQLLLTIRRKYVTEAQAKSAFALIGEIQRMIAAMRRKLAEISSH
jgi:four helix bundle protein